MDETVIFNNTSYESDTFQFDVVTETGRKRFQGSSQGFAVRSKGNLGQPNEGRSVSEAPREPEVLVKPQVSGGQSWNADVHNDTRQEYTPLRAASIVHAHGYAPSETCSVSGASPPLDRSRSPETLDNEIVRLRECRSTIDDFSVAPNIGLNVIKNIIDILYALIDRGSTLLPADIALVRYCVELIQALRGTLVKSFSDKDNLSLVVHGLSVADLAEILSAFVHTLQSVTGELVMLDWNDNEDDFAGVTFLNRDDVREVVERAVTKYRSAQARASYDELLGTNLRLRDVQTRLSRWDSRDGIIEQRQTCALKHLQVCIESLHITGPTEEMLDHLEWCHHVLSAVDPTPARLEAAVARRQAEQGQSWWDGDRQPRQDHYTTRNNLSCTSGSCGSAPSGVTRVEARIGSTTISQTLRSSGGSGYSLVRKPNAVSFVGRGKLCAADIHTMFRKE